jgi:hypothetical protein
LKFDDVNLQRQKI